MDNLTFINVHTFSFNYFVSLFIFAILDLPRAGIILATYVFSHLFRNVTLLVLKLIHRLILMLILHEKKCMGTPAMNSCQICGSAGCSYVLLRL